MTLLLHLQGILLFLFIPLVLFLFLQYPAGVPLSFLIAVVIMVAHRFVAHPFFLRRKNERCFWCGRTGRNRAAIQVRTGNETVAVELCTERCLQQGGAFLAFTYHYRHLLRIGIFVPLLWYIVTMLLNYYEIWNFQPDWNRFIFQFFIALTVVTISFAYRWMKPDAEPAFTFPIHNLFLLGAKNTLLVFRYVGIWWLASSLHFLWKHG